MYGPDALLLASKKPRIVDLVKRAKTMTEDEIKNLPEKPDVIRGLLLIKQFGDQEEKAVLAEKIAGAMQRNHVDQPKGDGLSCHVFRVNAIGETWLKTRSTMVEVKEGWHWAQLENGVVYLADAPITSDDESVRHLMSISTYIGERTLGEFKDLERMRRNGLSPTFIFQPV